MSTSSPAKIGLVTFPRYFNYGTHLQLYALQTAIERQGYSCEVVDYARGGVPQKPTLMQRSMNAAAALLKPGAFAERLRTRRYEQRLGRLTEDRWARFTEFLETYIHLGSRHYTSFEELVAEPPACTAFVTGSDQVWNPVGHHGDRTYFLQFAEREKRIAYAPSIGISTIRPEHQAWLRDGVNGIAHLSVREQRGAEIIRELTGREAEVVLDPTLLLSADDWRAIAREYPRPDKYVLLYALQGDPYVRAHAQSIATRHGLKLVVLPWHEQDVEDRESAVVKAYGIGPRKFIGLFRDASFVCTDSFHGSVFSILFRRPFYTFRRYENALEASFHSRIEHLLRMTGLEDREMHRERELPAEVMAVDFDGAEQRLAVRRAASDAYLRTALRTATGQG